MPSVSEPASVRAAAGALREAAAGGLRVSVEHEGGDLVLSTARLDRVLEHEAGDLTATVEAGIRLSALNAALAAHGQMLALDPPSDPSVGACIAGDLSGPRRHRYGTVRDLVLGVTVVLADGTVASSGGKVVKNVAGYDLGKLFCGSCGRLGLIARASLRLHPRPAAARTLVVRAETPGGARQAVQALHRSTLVPSAVDVLWPGRICVLFEGMERAAAAQLDAARSLLGGAEDGDAWREVAERQLAARGRIAFPPGRLEHVLSARDTALVRAGAGIAYVPDPVPDAPSDALRALGERVRAGFDPRGTLA
ncbi:MAG: FAD-binding oxidoreductase [Gaiellaceae bacterium]